MMCLDFDRMQSFFSSLFPQKSDLWGEIGTVQKFRVVSDRSTVGHRSTHAHTAAPYKNCNSSAFSCSHIYSRLFLLCVDFYFVCPIIVFLFFLRIWISCDNNLFKQRNQLRIRYRTENSIISFLPTCVYVQRSLGAKPNDVSAWLCRAVLSISD